MKNIFGMFAAVLVMLAPMANQAAAGEVASASNPLNGTWSAQTSVPNQWIIHIWSGATFGIFIGINQNTGSITYGYTEYDAATRQVVIQIKSQDQSTLSGTMNVNDTQMSGTMHNPVNGNNGTWSATKK